MSSATILTDDEVAGIKPGSSNNMSCKFTMTPERTVRQPYSPLIILTTRLILLPTPLAISHPRYTTLYASLHHDAAFCAMAFGSSPGSFQPVDWISDNKVLEVIAAEVHRSWEVRGMGDFAVGLLSQPSGSGEQGGQGGNYRLMDGRGLEDFVNGGRSRLKDIMWIGYCGVRDATTTSIPVWGKRNGDEVESMKDSPAWQDMIELRYGFHDSAWGRGYGTEAAQAVLRWCEEERGGRRFIAETEKENGGSKSILGKLGFVALEDVCIWGLEGTVEWERRKVHS